MFKQHLNYLLYYRRTKAVKFPKLKIKKENEQEIISLFFLITQAAFLYEPEVFLIISK